MKKPRVDTSEMNIRYRRAYESLDKMERSLSKKDIYFILKNWYAHDKEQCAYKPKFEV
jgi:hypothetical protein